MSEHAPKLCTTCGRLTDHRLRVEWKCTEHDPAVEVPINLTLDLSSWTRLAEVVVYADEHFDGDIAEAIQRLVNSGLSHLP